ncbi:MAG: hypothetical protein Q9172_002224 [Xanthocarpia lactea]
MPHWPSWRSKKGKGNGKKAGERSGSPAPQAGHETERSGLFSLASCASDIETAVESVATGMLQQEGIAARIWSFGYDSRTAFAKAVVDIEDVADMLLDGIEGRRDSAQGQSRPLIFVAYSLGGIVVKKAIIRAHERSQHYGGLLQSIHGIVFMGVPHRGADSARWASLVANILQVGQLGLGTNTNFVEALKRNSPTFSDISRQFVERAKLLTIRTFFETERWGNQVIVDKDSAVLNLPNEIAIGVPQANHSTICKFEHVDSQKYYPVWNAVKKLCQSALGNKRTDDASHLEKSADNLDRRQMESYENSKARVCHRIFKTSDYEGLKNLNPDRADGTCEWVFKHPSYREWYDNGCDDLLWISADPGCGKSVLSKSLIDRDLSESQAHRVCYFFFKDNEDQNSLTLALCALIHQLFTDQPGLIRHAIPSWDKAGDSVQREADELWRILLSASRDEKAGRTICVLDALDECRENDQQRLITMLAAFSRNRSTNPSRGWVKFVVTSRPYEWIQDQFQETLQSWPSIRLRGEEENDQIGQEIDLVIQEKVEKLASDLKFGASTKDRLKCDLLTMKHRTYLWLYLAIEGIREQYRESFRPHKESIISLPTTVEDAYEKILERGAVRNKDNAYKILRIVVGARRPLTISEMAIALGVDTSPSSGLELDIEKTYLETHLPQWCGLFVYINHSRIYLIHQTAKEFLVRGSAVAVANNQGWKHCLDAADIEQSMTRICVRYLTQKNLDLVLSETNFSRVPDVTTISGGPFYRKNKKDRFWAYSAVNWAGHARSIQDEAPMSLMKMIMELYNTTGERFKHWFPIFWNNLYRNSDPPVMTGIRLAALNGHSDILQKLLESNASDLDATDENGDTALILGSEFGYAEVVRVLLEKGADANAQGGQYGNVLHVASEHGHSQVVQVLLDKGADINAQGKYYCNALQAASIGGYNQVVQMLLDKGADINAQGGVCGNALQAASRSGSNQVVQILLDKGADINAQGGLYGNALQAALSQGNDQVVQMLRDHGAISI